MKARERIYFKSKDLVEAYKAANPGVIMTRFISSEDDVYKSAWIGYEVQEQVEANPQPASGSTNTQVPEIA